MKPNLVDLQFWRNKTTPKWAEDLVGRELITIDQVISSRDLGIRRKDLCTGNLINLLTMRMRNERRQNPEYSVCQALYVYATSPHHCPDKKKRTALCIKWSARIVAGRRSNL